MRIERINAPAAVHLALHELLSQYAFLAAAGVDADRVMWACEDGASRGIAPHLLLIHDGVLTSQQYLELFEASLPGAGAKSVNGISEIVDAVSLTPAAAADAVAAIRARGNAPLLLMRQQIDWSEPPEARAWRADQAANGLLRRSPHLSAGSSFVGWQQFALPILLGLSIGGMIVTPEVTWIALGAVVSIPFLLIVGLRLLALIVVLGLPQSRASAPVAEAELPVYSVIVPLFREAEVVPALVEALRRLDYPPAKLDILLITESVDAETQAALRTLSLPPHMRVLVVPDQLPRTKPKALNYGLRVACGDYIVIFDAEDEPERDQLRRAVQAFKEGPANLMCLQGRLALYNERPGWIARQFILEYAALFDGLLPALVRLGLPVPLGGTSNHFPRKVLDELGGWDAYNVTEDADLGIRIARAGGQVGVLYSTTFEEAPDSFIIWIRQRTRWMKGFMQTWLVHMRRPGRLRAELGWRGFIGFNAILGGIILSALIHPFFILFLAWELAVGQLLVMPETAVGAAMLAFCMFNLFCGYVSAMVLAGVAARRRGVARLLPNLVLMPLYWLMISAAAYRAALQLVRDPYLWEKTPHKARTAAAPDAAGISRSTTQLR